MYGNDMLKNNSHPLMDMDVLKVKKKSIKRFCLNDPDEQLVFDEIYNDENVAVVIIDNYHDQIGNYYLVCNIQEMCTDKTDDKDEK